MAYAKGDGIFVGAVLVIVTMLLTVIGFGGLGGARYGSFALLLLFGAGGVAYFALRGSEGFGMKMKQGALLNAALALVGAVVFTSLLIRGADVLSSIAAVIVAGCATPLIAIAVRSRSMPSSA